MFHKLKDFFRKKEETEEIPPGFIKCTKCGRIVSEEKATFVLPEKRWVCDDCFFGNAE